MKTKFLSISNKSLSDLGAVSYKELWEKAKKEGYKGLTIQVKTDVTRAEENLFHAVFSTAKEDRHGEIVFQNWDLKAFKKNPVYLDSHNYDGIEHILGRIDRIKSDKILEGDIVFALDNPKGLLAYNLTQKGFLNTSSVGFIPKEFDDNGNILSAELLEISAVSVPANAEALIDSNKSANTEEKSFVEEATIVKISANAIIKKMAQRQSNALYVFSKAVENINKDNLYSQKREMLNALRKIQRANNGN